METINIQQVSFSYPGSEHKALQHIDLSFEESGFYLLCGASGCGKSTLLRHMKKSLIPYGSLEGDITYQGISIDELDDRTATTAIGFVSQSPQDQIVTDKVWHELAFGLENLGRPNDVIKRRVAEMANFFGISSWFRRDIKELSGGQMQMVNLASVMAMQPKVLILDEPTSQLDPLAASDFLYTILRINRELGTMVIISEHRLEEVFPMADKVIVMQEGEVRYCDEPYRVAEQIITCGRVDGNALYEGLPAAIRIATGVEKKQMGQAPLTIREGRIWLNKYLQGCGYDVEHKKTTLEHDTFAKLSKDGYETEATHSRANILTMKDVCFRYQPQDADILYQCNVNVYQGEWFALLGGNGAGKSTTLNLISGILKPYRGTVTTYDDTPDQSHRKNKSIPLGYQGMVMLPQDPKTLFTEITVEEELQEALMGLPMEEEQQNRRMNRIKQMMRLEGMEQHHPYDLSGGEQQRLALAKLFLLEPKLLLLDEPTKGLDPEFKEELAGVLQEQQKQGLTIMMVSHDIEFCGKYADRCGMFFDREVMAVQETRAFFAGNNFYTTAANRIARKWFPTAVTCEEVVKLCDDISIQ